MSLVSTTSFNTVIGFIIAPLVCAVNCGVLFFRIDRTKAFDIALSGIVVRTSLIQIAFVDDG